MLPIPFEIPKGCYDDGLFNPFEDLIALSYTTLTHLTTVTGSKYLAFVIVVSIHTRVTLMLRLEIYSSTLLKAETV